MAHTKSALKAIRQTAKRRVRNRHHISGLRTAIKKLRTAIAVGDAKQAQELLPETVSVIDRSIQKGVLQRNAAARYKSRLTTQVNKLAQPSAN